MTKAHESEVTIRLIERWPEHEPRASDPHYHLFHQAKERMKRQGLLKCNVESDYHYGQIELHHDKVEFAHVNDIDVEKFNHAYGLDLTDEQFAEYVEQEGNLEPLCLPGDAPVLMADGTQRQIRSIAAGDKVVGPDGCTRPVTALLRRDYEGQIVQLDGRWLTADHPVLTPRGWLPASAVGVGDQVGEYLGMLSDDVGDVVRIEPQILRAIVGSAVVDVVDSLLGVKGPTEFLFHHMPVLKDGIPPVTTPDEATHVPLRRLPASKEHALGGSTPSRFGLQRGHATRLTAVAGISRARVIVSPAVVTLPRSKRPRCAAPRGRALPRAGRVMRREIGRHPVRKPTDAARLDDAFARFHPAWRPVRHVARRFMFSGQVYDITVAGCPAFITGGLIVHNCTLHHRGQEGVHSLPEPEWQVLRVAKDPKLVITALSNSEIAVQPPPTT